MDPFWGPFILYCEQVENPRRGFAKFDSCTKCEEANFALDTSEASASPKGLTATLRQQGILRANKPFSRSKIKDQVEGLVFYFTSDISGSRTREEGSTKFDHGRSPKSEFWNYRVSDKPVRVRSQPR